MSSELKELEVQ